MYRVIIDMENMDDGPAGLFGVVPSLNAKSSMNPIANGKWRRQRPASQQPN